MQTERPADNKRESLKPIFSLAPDIQAAALTHAYIDENSKALLKDKTDNRFAVVGFIDENKMDLRVKVGLPSNATLSEIREAKKKYGSDNVVVAKDKQTGIVHQDLVAMVLEKEPHLKGKKTIGFSVWKSTSGGKITLTWLNRSAQNFYIFLRDPFALFCNAFVDDQKSSFNFDNFYDLNRSIPQSIFDSMCKHATQLFTDTQDDKKSEKEVICIIDEEECYSYLSEKFWNEILKLDEKERNAKVQQAFMRSLFIIVREEGALAGKQTRGKSGYELLLKEALESAKKKGIVIDLNVSDSEYSEKAITLAARRGYQEIVSLLIKHGANIEVRNSQKNTALAEAAIQGHTQIAIELLKHGADTSVVNHDDNTPFELAVKHDHFELAKTILNYTAKSVEDHKETTAHTPQTQLRLLKSISEGDTTELKEYLSTDFDNSLNLKTEKDKYFFHLVIFEILKRNSKEMLKLIMPAIGKNVSIENQLNIFNKILREAVRSENLTSLKFGLENSDIFQFNEDELFEMSVRYGSPIAVQFFLDKITLPSTGIDALCKAAVSSNVDVVRYLLDQKVIPRQNSSFESPMQLATLSHADKEVLKMLAKAGGNTCEAIDADNPNETVYSEATPELQSIYNEKIDKAVNAYLVGEMKNDFLYKEELQHWIMEHLFNALTASAEERTKHLAAAEKGFELAMALGHRVSLEYIPPSFKLRSSYSSILEEAAAVGDLEMMNLIFNLKNEFIEDYRTDALCVAAANNQIDAAKLLLNQKVNPGKVDDVNHSPLTIAAHHGHIELVKIFLEAQQDSIYRYDDIHKNELEIAYIEDLEQHNVDGILKFISTSLDYINDVDALEFRQFIKLGLHTAIKNQTPEILKLFFSEDNELIKEAIEELAYLSVIQNNTQAIKLLIDAGMDLDIIVTSEKDTLLNFATLSGNTDMMKLLLKAGADPWYQNSEGRDTLVTAKIGAKTEDAFNEFLEYKKIDFVKLFSLPTLDFKESKKSTDDLKAFLATKTTDEIINAYAKLNAHVEQGYFLHFVTTYGTDDQKDALKNDRLFYQKKMS